MILALGVSIFSISTYRIVNRNFQKWPRVIVLETDSTIDSVYIDRSFKVIDHVITKKGENRYE